MPSLNALGEFKDSFYDIANERNDSISRNLPVDNFPLPDTEAAPLEPAARDVPPPDTAVPSEPAKADAGDFDFGALIGSTPVDVTPPPVDDIINDVHPPDSEPPGIDDLFNDETPPLDEEPLSSGDGLLSDEELLKTDDTPPVDNVIPDDDFQITPPEETPSTAENDFSIPDDLLSGLSDETETAPADFPTEDFPSEEASPENIPTEEFPTEDTTPAEFAAEDFPSEDTSSEDIPSEDLESNLPDGADLGGENNEESGGGDSEELPDFDLPTPEPVTEEDYNIDGEKQDDTSTTDSISDDALFSEEMPASDDSLPDLPDEDTLAQDDAGFDGSLPDFDLPEPDTSGGMESGADDSSELGDLDLGREFESDDIQLETEPETHAKDDLAGDDFVLPGLDDMFEKSKAAPAAPAPKKGLFGGLKKEEAREEPEAENVEEIQLRQEDLDNLLGTLHSYPLNLRIACQELIAEKVLEPQQLSKLLRLLINGANVKEMAEFAGQLLGKTIVIPKSFQKSSGAAWEAEKASFAYIFVHNFLPVLRLFAFIAAVAGSIAYLGYRFLYIPYKAETIYKRGYERIFAGEYQRANELFHEAFVTHRKKNWFYEYAKGFRDQRRYMLAEAKYDELLRYYPRDKQGVLEYADLETNYIMNYDKANRILQEQLLDYAPNDYDGLLAAGDNFFAWADSDPSRFFDKYEDARFSYARLMEQYGWTSPVVERIMKYFIRTDDLKEVLSLRSWFESGRDRRLSPASTAELGGYLLDKQLEEVKGVPNLYVESIESVRAMLLQAVREDPLLPEPHYHLARYYNSHGNAYEERLTLENAIRAFDLAESESVRRRLYNVDTRYRYANLLINNREFFPADEQLVEGIKLYEDYVSRNLITVSPQLGQLYALRGDLEYFVKTGNMQAALNNYRVAERYGWSPPETQYRMGAAYYQLEDWGNALEYLFKASADLPLNRRLLYALGNTAYKRGDYFAAQGYYNRLIDVLENQRVRLPVTLPNDRPEFLELGERLMMARNNAGVVNEALAEQTGNREYRSQALYLYSESARAWDSITRNPTTMARMNLTDMPGTPGINLGFLNAGNALRPVSDYSPEIFIRIDKDVFEPSQWEELAPFGGLTN